MDRAPTSEQAWEVVLRQERNLWRHAHRRVTSLPPGVEKEDVVSGARLHMHRLLGRWDPARASFQIYTNQCASWSVGLAISELVPSNEGRHGAIDTVCWRAWERFTEREGRSPSSAELIAEAGPSPRLGRYSTGAGLSESQVQRWLTGSRPRNVKSLDLPHPVTEKSVADYLEGRERPMDETVDVRIMGDKVEAVLSTLTERERVIWDGVCRGLRLSDMGEMLDLSRERVRQIRNGMLAVLQERLGLDHVPPAPHFFSDGRQRRRRSRSHG
jgi:RNA polymerase sigma factor (sigma-70 family)